MVNPFIEMLVYSGLQKNPQFKEKIFQYSRQIDQVVNLQNVLQIFTDPKIDFC